MRPHMNSFGNFIEGKYSESLSQTLVDLNGTITEEIGRINARPLERVMNILISHALFYMAPNTFDLIGIAPHISIQKLRSFAFVWCLACLNRCTTMAERKKRNCFKTSGTPCSCRLKNTCGFECRYIHPIQSNP